MKRICGLILFFVGVGMAIMLFVPIGFLTVCIILMILILGYNLFCS